MNGLLGPSGRRIVTEFICLVDTPKRGFIDPIILYKNTVLWRNVALALSSL